MMTDLFKIGLSFAVIAAVAALDFRFGTSRPLVLASWPVLALAVLFAMRGVFGDHGLRALIVDDRNRLNQANLITLTWFLIIASAMLAFAFYNFGSGKPAAAIFPTVPAHIYGLAGITLLNQVGVAVIKHEKMSRTNTKALQPPAGGYNVGTVFVRTLPAQAKLSDLFTLDETGAEDKVELAGVQNFVFNMAAMIIYTTMLGQLLWRQETAAFPELPESILALLGVTTIGALVNRAVPR